MGRMISCPLEDHELLEKGDVVRLKEPYVSKDPNVGDDEYMYGIVAEILSEIEAGCPPQGDETQPYTYYLPVRVSCFMYNQEGDIYTHTHNQSPVFVDHHVRELILKYKHNEKYVERDVDLEFYVDE